MHTYTHTYIHACMHAHTHTHAHTHINTHTHTYICQNTYMVLVCLEQNIGISHSSQP